MFCLTLPTNLMDGDSEPVIFGPYSFPGEEAREEWKEYWELALTGLNDELLGSYIGAYRIRTPFDEQDALHRMAPAPPVEHLINQLRLLCQNRQVTLIDSLLAA